MININELGSNYTQTIKKLEKVGIKTVEEICKFKPEELAKKINIGVGTAQRMLEIAEELVDKEKRKTQIADLSLPDPDMINTPYKWTVADIYEKIREGNLTVPRDFQREEFWSIEQKQDLVDSIAVGITIPPIYVFKNKDTGKWEIVDGQQRVGSIRDMMDGTLTFNFTSPKALEQKLDIMNGFIINDAYERNQRLYNQLISRQLDVVELSGVSREEVQDFYITLNSSGGDMRNGELYYAIRGAFHSVLMKCREHPIFTNIRRSPRKGDIEGVTILLSLKYNDGFKLKEYKRHKNSTITQFRNISAKAADELLTNFMNDLTWCEDILCHINYGNGIGASVNIISVLLSIREDNEDLDQEMMIRCLDYIYTTMNSSMLYPKGFREDFENIREYNGSSSATAIYKCWKAIERIYSKGGALWENPKPTPEILF